jgi:hypothetical protein
MPLLSRVVLLISFMLSLFAACQSKNEQPATTTSTTVVDDDTLATDVSLKQPQRSPDHFVIIPGEQAGVVRANTSEAKLIELLGTENVTKADTVWGTEGDFYIGTTLFKGTPDEAQILWKDAARTQPESVMIRAETAELNEAKPALKPSQWTTENGLRIGSTLREVEQLNGKAFTVYGFGWDYGGNVSNWQDGKLQTGKGKSYLSVGFNTSALTPAQEKIYEKVMGDSEFASSNPAMQQLNPTVQTITISFRH